MKCFDSKELKVWSNKEERTFTIKKYDESGKCYAKYRTIRQSGLSFCHYNQFATLNDWKQFLTTDEYYEVKGGRR